MCAGVQKYQVSLALTTLLAASALVLLWNLGGPAFIDYDEAAYAQVVRETAASGNSMTFTFIGDPWFDKPPFYFWAARGLQFVVDDPELAMRLPSAVSGIACVLLVWLIAYELTRRPGVAFCAGALLLATGAFVDAARQVRMDSMITAVILFALYAYLRGRDDARWYLGIGAAVGVGVMVKSIVGLFALPVVLLVAVSEWRLVWLRNVYVWLGALIGVIIAAPWHIYETIWFGERFWNHYLFTHVIDRYTDNLFANSATNMVYATYVGAYALPLVFMFVVTLVCYALWYRHVEGVRTIGGLLLAIFALTALFLTAGTKVAHYLLPLYPLAAIVVAVVGGSLLRRLSWPVRSGVATAILLVLVVSGVHAVAIGFHLVPHLNYEHRLAEEERLIGLRLSKEQSTVYFASPVYWETVRFYSGGKTLRLLNTNAEPRAIVIVHGNYAARTDTASYEPFFEGNLISAYRMPTPAP